MTRLLNVARTAAFAGLISGCIAMSAPAFAADSDVLPQGTIALHGADLTAPAAIAHLKRRLRQVAANICTPQPSGEILMNRSEQACYDTAVRDGLAQIAGRQQQAMRERAVRLADTSDGAITAQ